MELIKWTEEIRNKLLETMNLKESVNLFISNGFEFDDSMQVEDVYEEKDGICFGNGVHTFYIKQEHIIEIEKETDFYFIFYYIKLDNDLHIALSFKED